MMLVMPPRGAPGRPGPRRPRPPAGFRLGGAAIAAIAGIAMWLGVTDNQRRAHASGDLGLVLALVSGGLIFVVAAVAGIARKGAHQGDAPAADDDAATGSDHDDSTRMDVDRDARATTDGDPDSAALRRRIAILIAVVAAVIAAAVLLFSATSRRAGAQAPVERGGFAILRGGDTLVHERFIRAAGVLQGDIRIKGGARVAYFATLAPGEMVQSLTLSAWAPGAADSPAPLRQVPMTFHGDTVIVQAAQGLQRVPTRHGAIPLVNNSIALTELVTRRARSLGSTADVPLFAVSGGATLTTRVVPVGGDSVVMTIGTQEQRLAVDAIGRITGGLIPAAQLRVVRLGPDAAGGLALAAPVASAPPKPDYSAPPGAPYTAEDVTLRGPGGITLGGTLTRPPGAGPFPAVVTITGSGLQDRDEFIPLAGGVRLFRQIADTLSRRGIAVLRLDDRGIGASTGDPTTATTADFADDTRAAVAYLRTRTDIDSARIGLIGHSEGGMIAPMVAASDLRIRAIVVMAGPASKGAEISKAQNRYAIDHMNISQARKDSMYSAAVQQIDHATLDNAWARFWFAYDPAVAAGKVKAPVLIMQGATDRQVPASEAEKLAGFIREGGNRDVTVRLFPAVDHLFLTDPDGNFANYDKLPSNKVSPAVLGTIADWIALKLARAPGR